MNLTITIPDPVKDRVIDAICASHGYPLTVKDAQGNDVPNPNPRGAFAKQAIIDHIRQMVSNYEETEAINSARQAAKNKVSQEISLS